MLSGVKGESVAASVLQLGLRSVSSGATRDERGGDLLLRYGYEWVSAVSGERDLGGDLSDRQP